MSGVKGRSGGARPNTGGKRPGAGRKPLPPTFTDAVGSDAEDFLMSVVRDKSADAKLRLEAAKAILPYQKAKIAEVGKKEAQKGAARKVIAGRFGPAHPPRLVVNNTVK